MNTPLFATNRWSVNAGVAKDVSLRHLGRFGMTSRKGPFLLFPQDEKKNTLNGTAKGDLPGERTNPPEGLWNGEVRIVSKPKAMQNHFTWQAFRVRLAFTIMGHAVLEEKGNRYSNVNGGRRGQHSSKQKNPGDSRRRSYESGEL